MVDNSPWLSLSEAAQLLGVHFTTLRRWTNAGLVEHIRTPGGKRKYTRKAIEEFLERHRSRVSNPLALHQFTSKLVSKTREELRTSDIPDQAWYLQLSEAHRLQMRNSGNRLIALLFQYCARDANGDVFLKEGDRIAHEYGRFCFSVGMTLAECTRTFLFFRRSMLNSIHETGTLQGMADVDSHQLFQRMVYFLDEITVGMVSEYSNP